MRTPSGFLLAFIGSVLLLGLPGLAQQPPQPEAPKPAALDVQPTELTVKVGEKAMLKATVRDAAGQVVQAPVVFFSRARRSVGVSADGTVEAYRPGKHVIVALVPRDPEDEPRRADAILQVEVPVTVPNPPIKTVEFTRPPRRFYAGTTVPLRVTLTDTSGERRADAPVAYTTSNAQIAAVDRFGRLTLRQPGSATVTATAEAVRATLAVTVEANPVRAFELTATRSDARTGDVVRFTAAAKDAQGRPVPDVPVAFAVQGRPLETIIAPGATAQIEPDGRFVAERAGQYTVVATTGSHVATQTIDVTSRDVGREIEVVGHGPVRDRHTSDLWVWTAPNGRDYAITGTWGADGHAYFWDVTDPKNPQLVDTVRVDARTVNDVKISEDGRLAVISREGASNRRNGIVILDVSDPVSGVRILSRFDDQLTGGVHNVFVHKDHVYAVNNGRRYDIINVEDPTKPARVGRFELDTPGHSLHDVWVVDGIAYSSNWTEGVVVVDVGGGGKGGTPAKPVKMGSYAYPSGWNHAAFPYRSKSTGKFYVFIGDEAFPYGFETQGGSRPSRADGWIHVVEWDQWGSPREIARYQVPEAGTHNLWVEDDILYVAYYNGGLRVVDVSGELVGDLYKQGREIASFKPYDPKGFIANAPFVWGPQPFKGNIFFSDWNSGLWIVRLAPKKEGRARVVGEPHP